MNTTQPSARSGRPLTPPPVLPSADRDDERTSARESERVSMREASRSRPREEAEKFSLVGCRSVDPRMDYMWGSLRIPFSTLKNPRFDRFRQAGWQICRAEEFPEHSGHKPSVEVNQRYVELGIDSKVLADDP